MKKIKEIESMELDMVKEQLDKIGVQMHKVWASRDDKKRFTVYTIAVTPADMLKAETLKSLICAFTAFTAEVITVKADNAEFWEEQAKALVWESVGGEIKIKKIDGELAYNLGGNCWYPVSDAVIDSLISAREFFRNN
jgi:hypothetical protein